MEIDTFLIDPIDEPERFFAQFIASVYVPDTVRPKDERWCVPIDFDKLSKILDEGDVNDII